jgi:hypothetical protein
MFDAWSTDALRGYIVMLGEFLSGSMQEEPQREAYARRLSDARLELAARESEETGPRASVAFPRESTTREEPDDTAS